MSREKKFHQWIESQNQEEKDRVWKKIEERMANGEGQPIIPVEKTAVKNKWSWKKITAIATACVAVVCLSVVTLVKFLGGEEIRYCTADQYTNSATTKTVKQYSQEIGKNILYFDWYDTTEYVEDFVYTLNETSEIICYRENILNPETGDLLTIYVTQKSIQMDFLEKIGGDKKQVYTHNNVRITWEVFVSKGYASFEYGDYKYNLELSEPLEEDDVLEYAKLLLS